MLAKTLERAYNHKSAIDLKSLCILPGKQCWVLYIDALVRQYVNSISSIDIAYAFISQFPPARPLGETSLNIVSILKNHKYCYPTDEKGVDHESIARIFVCDVSETHLKSI